MSPRSVRATISPRPANRPPVRQQRHGASWVLGPSMRIPIAPGPSAQWASRGLGLSPSSALSRPRRYCWWLPSRRPRGVDHHAADDRIVVVSSGRSRVGVCDHLFLSSRGHDFSPVVALTPSNLPTSWVAACRELLVQGPHQLSGCCLGEPVAVLAFAEQGPPLVPHSRKGPAQWRGPRSIARNRKRSACPGRADRQRRPTECVRPHRGAPSGMRVCPAVTT